MSTPVRQGVAVRGQTKIYVLNPAVDSDGAVPTPESIPDMGIDETDSDPSGSSSGDFEIGEDFLAGSTLRSLSMSNSSPSPSLPLDDHLVTGDSTTPTEMAESSGAASTLHLSSIEWTCSAYTLSESVSILEDECAVYVRTADLSRIGVLDGDWVSPHLQ